MGATEEACAQERGLGRGLADDHTNGCLASFPLVSIVVCLFLSPNSAVACSTIKQDTLMYFLMYVQLIRVVYTLFLGFSGFFFNVSRFIF